MKKFVLNKLVRGGVVDDMEAKGQRPEHRVLEGSELVKALGAKVVEEAAELNPTGPDALKELADLQTAIDELVDVLGATPEQVTAIQDARQQEAGDLSGHIYVLPVKLDVDTAIGKNWGEL